MPRLELTPEQIADLLEAIDSHVYWQLADDQHRNDGATVPPGSDDPEDQATIARFGDLSAHLAAAAAEGGR